MVGVLALLQVAAVSAAPLPLPESPQWLQRPTAAEYEQARPRDSHGQGLNGNAILACDITAEGRLSACKTEQETPAGQGFGQAAIAIAPSFRMAATTSTGAPVGGHTLRVRIRFMPPLPEGMRLVHKPKWLKRPGGGALSRYYPDRAQRMGVAGQALLQCTVGEDGGLGACAVLDEDPGEFGFGAAALRLAPSFQMEPTDGDGQPVANAVFRVTITFKPG